MNITNIERVWQLPIPVDVWIRKISKEIFQENLTDDEIRERWRSIGSESEVKPMVADTAIWLIGNNLDDWGEDYLKELLDKSTFEYL